MALVTLFRRQKYEKFSKHHHYKMIYFVNIATFSHAFSHVTPSFFPNGKKRGVGKAEKFANHPFLVLSLQTETKMRETSNSFPVLEVTRRRW